MENKNSSTALFLRLLKKGSGANTCIHILNKIQIQLGSWFMYQNGLPHLVNLLSKLARALVHGGKGMGLSPGTHPHSQGNGSSISGWECSSDVTGYTASSSKPRWDSFHRVSV